MQGKTVYQTGVRLWMDGERAVAAAAFEQGSAAPDPCCRALCRGFAHFLSGESRERRSAGLEQFARAALLGGTDFAMLFAVGEIARGLVADAATEDDAGQTVLLLLAKRTLHAVQVEMPRPMLLALERQYGLALAYLTDQLDYRLQQLRQRSPQVDTLIERLCHSSSDLDALVAELEVVPVALQLCSIDRLLVVAASLSRRSVAGRPLDATELIALL